MAMCDDCQQEMTTAASCTVGVLGLGGERFERERVDEPIGRAGRCGDCGVQRDGFHHLGCDLESVHGAAGSSSPAGVASPMTTSDRCSRSQRES